MPTGESEKIVASTAYTPVFASVYVFLSFVIKPKYQVQES